MCSSEFTEKESIELHIKHTHTQAKQTQAKQTHRLKLHTIMPKFYKKQVQMAEKIYESVSYWNILCAQMQSGKTATAFFWALLMLFTGKVKKIFIISGSSDTELRDQWIKTFDSPIQKNDNSDGEDSDDEYSTADEDYDPEEVEESDTLLTEFLMNYLSKLTTNVFDKINPHTLKDKIKGKIHVVFRQDITKKISIKKLWYESGSNSGKEFYRTGNQFGITGR